MLCLKEKFFGFSLEALIQGDQETPVTAVDEVVHPSGGVIGPRIRKEEDSHLRRRIDAICKESEKCRRQRRRNQLICLSSPQKSGRNRYGATRPLRPPAPGRLLTCVRLRSFPLHSHLRRPERGKDISRWPPSPRPRSGRPTGCPTLSS